MRNLIIGIITILCISSCMKYEDEYIEVEGFPTISWVAAADSSSSQFVANYWNRTRHFFNNDQDGTIGWGDYWPEAHGLDVLIDAYLRTEENTYKQCIYDFYEGVKAKNGNKWKNDFYDDMGWHGMAHMRALEATGDTRYEESAKELWELITEGWTEYDGGGIQWKEGTDDDAISKGIPANGPAAIIAARRYQKYPNEVVNGYNNLEWLQRIYEWMKYYRTDPSTGRVYEVLNNTNSDYSYDYGTFIGAALEFYAITGDRMYFNDAVKVADYHISTNINSQYRVMTDWGEQTAKGAGHDCNLFKGIFVRYFTILIQHPDLPEGNRKKYIAFLRHNANHLWFMGTQKDPTIKFSPSWWTIPDEAFGDLRSAISGATCIEAMALLEKEGYLE